MQIYIGIGGKTVALHQNNNTDKNVNNKDEKVSERSRSNGNKL